LLLRSLERAGLTDVAAEPVDAPILLGGRGTFDDVVEYVTSTAMLRRMLANADDDQRARVVESIPEALAPYQTDDGVQLGAAAWIVSARRR
jgi:hypothetical protein